MSEKPCAIEALSATMDAQKHTLDADLLQRSGWSPYFDQNGTLRGYAYYDGYITVLSPAVDREGNTISREPTWSSPLAVIHSVYPDPKAYSSELADAVAAALNTRGYDVVESSFGGPAAYDFRSGKSVPIAITVAPFAIIVHTR